MKNLKNPTVGILLATLIFSNIPVYQLYGYESEHIVENVNKQNVESNDTNVENKNNEPEENNTTDIVDIPDSNLKSIIYEALAKDQSSNITKNELSEIEEIDLYNITSLEGLQYCTNLNKLTILSGDISDISALSGLDNLESLDISANNISDISALSGLDNLRKLSIYNNNISDISALSGLDNLTSLSLSNNNISNISALSGLDNLTSLSLSNNNISNISVLSGLDNLTSLSLSNNNIGNISALSSLINLKGLYLSNSNIEDISVLSKMTKLEDIDLSKNYIRDITPLQNLNPEGVFGLLINLTTNPIDLSNSENINVITNLNKKYNFYYDEVSKFVNIPDSNLKMAINKELETNYDLDLYINPNSSYIAKTQLEKIIYLKLSNIDIEDLEGIEYCTKLKTLLMNNCNITDISKLSELKSLDTLQLNNNNISDISKLSELKSLDILSLDNNKISDINKLLELDNLSRLHLNNNEISDISPLLNMSNLTYLSLNNNNISKISDISQLSSMSNLTYLSLNNNKISSINALSNLKSLNTLSLENNAISDISPLSDIKNLSNLYISKNNISNIETLSSLTNLIWLSIGNKNISDTNIESIDALSELKNLTNLSISNTNIESIDALSNLVKLTYLELNDNKISDISPLSTLTKLEELILSGNEISNINPLSSITKLQNLDLSNNNISNITPLKYLEPDLENLKPELDYKLYINLTTNPIDLNNSENMKVITELKNTGYKIYYDKLNDEENEDSIYNDYKYRVSDSEITITRYFGKDKNITIPSEIDGMKVVEIEDRAFEGCSNLISVKIPEGIRSIGVMVFLECNNLIDIEVDNNNKAYKSIDGILYSKDGTKIILFPNRKTNVTIGQEVTSIEDYAFYGCSSLSSIEIPKGVTSIGYSALANCSNLKDIKIDKNNKEYKSIDGVLYSKDGTKIITVPGGKSNINIFEEVISIENDAFNGCSNLTSIKIPEGVTSIGRWAFDGCSSLKSIEIPKSVTLIGEYAFNGCSSLTSIKIPEGVKKIGGMTFSGCSSLKSIEIPKSVTLIEEYALSENLTTIYGYTGSYAESYAKEFNISFKALENLPIKNIEGTVIEEGNGTEASPLVLLLQEEKAIDELISNLENIFEYNIVGEPVIENNYKIYTLKLNNKVVRTNEYIKSNEDSSYIKLKVDLDDESTINKLDKIFIKDSEGGSSGGGSMLPPTQGNINGGGSIVKPSVTENKLVGTDRYQTAIKVSNEGWNKSESVVLVNSSAIVDALSATPFAKMKDAPILLTEKNTLNSETKKEITRLKAKNVYVIGGNNVISDSIINELKSMNINIERISGDDRYKTSLEIAKRLGDISEIAVVNGVTGLPDAISIAPVAASKKMPIVLASPTEGTKVFDEYMKDKNIKTSYVIGREAAISNEIANKLPNSERLGGDDRNDTNAVVIDKFYTSKNLNNIYVAKDGMSKQDDLIDALSVGVLASKQNSPVVIVGKDLNSNQESILSKKQPKKITQVGGNGNENVFNKLVNIFK